MDDSVSNRFKDYAKLISQGTCSSFGLRPIAAIKNIFPYNFTSFFIKSIRKINNFKPRHFFEISMDIDETKTLCHNNIGIKVFCGKERKVFPKEMYDDNDTIFSLYLPGKWGFCGPIHLLQYSSEKFTEVKDHVKRENDVIYFSNITFKDCRKKCSRVENCSSLVYFPTKVKGYLKKLTLYKLKLKTGTGKK